MLPCEPVPEPLAGRKSLPHSGATPELCSAVSADWNTIDPGGGEQNNEFAHGNRAIVMNNIDAVGFVIVIVLLVWLFVLKW
jgi:hypothetical protein